MNRDHGPAEHGEWGWRVRAMLGLCCVLACVWPAIATGAFGKNKVQSEEIRWHTLVTPHFEILHYEGAEELAVRASLIAENAYREYSNRLAFEIRIPARPGEEKS